MLLRRADLDAIKAGRIDLVFRRWRRPTVKTGGRLHTAVGLLAIHEVTPIALDDITPAEAGRAGFAEIEELKQALNRREGTVYRIALSYAGEDPRLALRWEDRLSPAEMDGLLDRLARLDAAAAGGSWTSAVLETIDRYPRRRAQELADELDLEKEVFKRNVRKLKKLGLTISHSPGYELSPRGRAVLAALRARD